MNGKQCHIVKYIKETDRFEVKLLEESWAEIAQWDLMSLPELQRECERLHIETRGCGEKQTVLEMLHAKRAQRELPGSAKEEAKVLHVKLENLRRLALTSGDTVQVHGLESGTGRLLNGQEGMATTLRSDAGRFEVRFRMLKVPYENLQKVTVSFAAGDCVEVKGLPIADGGTSLNGQRGRIVRHVKQTGDFEVCMGPSKMVAFKPQNLDKVPDCLNPGDLVEAHGLSSESGSQLNGKTGVIVDVVQDSDRMEILFEDGKSARLRLANLKLLPQPPLPPEPAAAASGA